MTQLTQSLWAIPISDDATNVRLRFDRFVTYRRPHSSCIVQPNEGTYEWVGLCSTEEITFDCEPYNIPELLQSHNLDISKRYLIIKKL